MLELLESIAAARHPHRYADIERSADVLTPAEAATLLGLSLNTTYTYLAQGVIPATRVGRRWILSRARLESWIAGLSSSGGR